MGTYQAGSYSQLLKGAPRRFQLCAGHEVSRFRAIAGGILCSMQCLCQSFPVATCFVPAPWNKWRYSSGWFWLAMSAENRDSIANKICTVLYGTVCMYTSMLYTFVVLRCHFCEMSPGQSEGDQRLSPHLCRMFFLPTTIVAPKSAPFGDSRGYRTIVLVIHFKIPTFAGYIHKFLGPGSYVPFVSPML
jgi:hypothetical protein